MGHADDNVSFGDSVHVISGSGMCYHVFTSVIIPVSFYYLVTVHSGGLVGFRSYDGVRKTIVVFLGGGVIGCVIRRDTESSGDVLELVFSTISVSSGSKITVVIFGVTVVR